MLKLAAAGVSALAASLLTVPLLFTSAPGAGASSCVGTGSIDGHAVPTGVEAAARVATQRTRVDELVLMAVTYRETAWGQAKAGVSDDQALAWLGDLARDVNLTAL